MASQPEKTLVALDSVVFNQQEHYLSKTQPLFVTQYQGLIHFNPYVPEDHIELCSIGYDLGSYKIKTPVNKCEFYVQSDEIYLDAQSNFAFDGVNFSILVINYGANYTINSVIVQCGHKPIEIPLGEECQ